MNKNDLMHDTRTICMTSEQLRTIAYALAHADMSGYTPTPQDELDAEGSTAAFMAEMAADTLADTDSNLLHGWAL